LLRLVAFAALSTWCAGHWAGLVVHPGGLRIAAAVLVAVALAAVLEQHPRVVADVSGVELGHSAAVHAFTDAQDRAGGWPRARLVLAAPGPLLASLLASSRVDRRVPVHPDVPTAVAHVDARPASVRAYWSFGVDPHAPGAARSRLRQVCAAWDVDDEVREAAEIVVTELVTNAVEHVASPTVVAVERLVGSFRLAVRDFDTEELPEVALPSPTSARGRGLSMVAAVSREWGVHTHADGKTVWAEMTTATA
jgi:anti-sigma regulatory factor (Ser/Thr protein kinase)